MRKRYVMFATLVSLVTVCSVSRAVRAAEVAFDLLPPPPYADFSPFMMTVSIAPPVLDATPTSAFGWRFHPITGILDFHTGLDLADAAGTPIYAAMAGTVSEAAYHESYGNYILIDHYNGFTTLYAHCRKLRVKVGQQVTRGQRIADMGATGDATGNHLHFEMRLNEVLLDPEGAYRGNGDA